jgi:hypothetical protein
MPEAERLTGLSRRSVLAVGAGVGLAVTGWSSSPATSWAVGTADAGRWRSAGRTHSTNGWPIDRASARLTPATVDIEGSGAVVETAADERVRTVLRHVARRFHYEVADLCPGEVVGFKPIRDFASQHESNHCSGTALDLLAGHFPAGSQGGFLPVQLAVVRDILAECAGVVRWGGDYLHSVDENHFEIGVGPADPRLTGLAARLSGDLERPDRGAGTGIELPFTPGRLGAAATFHRKHGPMK